MTAIPEENSPEADFAREVLAQAGLDPSGYRIGPLLRRVPACLRALRAATIPAARELLIRHPARLDPAVNALLIGTTAFFRDSFVFDELARQVVPGILARTAHPRVWSVACSEGAELYSVAMLFHLHLAPGNGEFLGTDCRESALQVARAGVYQTRGLEELPAGIAGEHLVSCGEVARIRRDLVSRVQWMEGDIMRDSAEPGWNLILCRNLAIYLESTAMNRLWEKLFAALKPGGYLVTGRAEKPAIPGLQRVGPCIYQKASI